MLNGVVLVRLFAPSRVCWASATVVPPPPPPPAHAARCSNKMSIGLVGRGQPQERVFGVEAFAPRGAAAVVSALGPDVLLEHPHDLVGLDVLRTKTRNVTDTRRDRI